MTAEEKREKNRIRMRKYRAEHPEYVAACRIAARAYYHADIERSREMCRDRNKRRWARAKCDPELYAKLMTYRQTPERKAKSRAYSSMWRKNHKKRYRRQQRLRYDRERAMCRQSPEFYALYRRQKRIARALYSRRHGLVKRAYRPRMSTRIPDTCSYGRVLDTRSVFLWNNLPAASLVAGRAYRAMQWRETHCDSFGRVCR